MVEKKEAKVDFIRWFSEIKKGDVGFAGGKGANLGEMYNNGFPVPPGFVITAQAYSYFVEKNELDDKIKKLVEKLDIENTAELNELAKKIRENIENAEIPEELANEILEAYEILDDSGFKEAKGSALDILKRGHEPPFVAVRSSATAEDLESVSENEHVLLKINGKPIYEKIKEIYNRFGDCTNYNVEVPAMRGNKVEWMTIKSLLKHSTDKPELYKIKTITGREITISSNHTLISLDEDILKPIITDVKQIKKGTKVPVIGLIPEINEEQPIMILDYVKGNDVINHDGKIMIKNNSNNWVIQNGMPAKIEVSEDFAYFLGLYASEGSTYKNNCVSITNFNNSLIEKIENYVKNLGIYKKSRINRGSIRIYSPTLVRFLHQTCGMPNENKKGKGKICSEKRVPNFVFGWSKKNIGAFLRGCFDGDGAVGEQISYTTTSNMLCGGILKLLEILGIGFYIDVREGIYRITIPLKDIFAFNEIVGFHDLNKKLKLNNLIKTYKDRKNHPEFKYNIVINDVLSNKIKSYIDKTSPLKEIEIAVCKTCKNEIEQTSYYKNKKRYYCRTCKRAFYGDEVGKKITKKQDYFDSHGRFKEGAKPWNYGNIKGRLSLNELDKIKDKYNLKDAFQIFDGTIKWEDVKEIIPVENSGDLYDFSVPEVENFAAGMGGIITHNSASFAGQQETFLNVKGKKELLKKVKSCFASLFTARAVYYREKKGFGQDVKIAVIVQKMIDSEKSGVIFSQNPLGGEDVVIESVFGLGEGIVSGRIKPDNYLVNRDFKVKEVNVAFKKEAIVRNSAGENTIVKLTEEKGNQQVLSNHEIIRLTQYAVKLEEHYGKPQDIEFAMEKGEYYIVQSRAITTKAIAGTGEISGEVLLSGLGASPGVASGKVKIVHKIEELEKVRKGDVLVTRMTNPDMVVSMQRAAAIVTDEGGITSHAAIVSREMGIPAVVGTGNATSILKEEQEITVDGFNGKILAGKGKIKLAEIKKILETRTKIKVILDLPEYAERAASSGVKGVGLVRLEGIIAGSGKHPIYYVKKKDMKPYVQLLHHGLKKIAEHFEEIWIRTSDIRSDEFKNLEGSGEVEGNPMLGNHGIRFSLRHPEILEAELTAAKETADEFPEKKIGLMMPQIVSVNELKETKRIANEIGMPENIKIGIMVETPSAVQIINELLEEGVDFISFGTNDLTQFTLAVDRNNEEVQYLYDEMHPAVLKSLSFVIMACRKYGVETSICGQAGSNEDMARFLVKEGIDSISVNADAAYEISRVIAELEKNKIENRDNEEVVEIVVDRDNAKKKIIGNRLVDRRGHEGAGRAGEISKVSVPIAVASADAEKVAKGVKELFTDQDIENIVLMELDREMQSGEITDLTKLNKNPTDKQGGEEEGGEGDERGEEGDNGDDEGEGREEISEEANDKIEDSDRVGESHNENKAEINNDLDEEGEEDDGSEQKDEEGYEYDSYGNVIKRDVPALNDAIPVESEDFEEKKEEEVIELNEEIYENELDEDKKSELF